MLGRVGACLALIAVVAGCASTQGVTAAGPDDDGLWVRDLDLSTRRGEVGAPFTATVSWRDNYIREPELAVSGLPPGLHFDPATRTVTGRPTRAGFFAVNLAVRKKVAPERAHRPRPDERWWPRSIELEIFEPVEGGPAKPEK